MVGHSWIKGYPGEPCANCGIALDLNALSVACNPAGAVAAPFWTTVPANIMPGLRCFSCAAPTSHLYDAGVGESINVRVPPNIAPQYVFGLIALCQTCADLETLAGLPTVRCTNVLAGPTWPTMGAPVAGPVVHYVPVAPKCDCGAAKASGTVPFKPGHSSWCSVAEGK